MSHKSSQKSRSASTGNSRIAGGLGRSASGQFQPITSGGSKQESEEGYLAEGAARVRELAEGHEGQAVVAALAAGFSIGVGIGLVIAGSRQRSRPEGLLSRIRTGTQRMMPEVSKRFRS